MTDEWITIGEVSERSGVTEPNIRRYVSAFNEFLPQRRSGGLRLLKPESAEIVKMIRDFYDSGRDTEQIKEHLQERYRRVFDVAVNNAHSLGTERESDVFNNEPDTNEEGVLGSEEQNADSLSVVQFASALENTSSLIQNIEQLLDHERAEPLNQINKTLSILSHQLKQNEISERKTFFILEQMAKLADSKLNEIRELKIENAQLKRQINELAEKQSTEMQKLQKGIAYERERLRARQLETNEYLLREIRQLKDKKTWWRRIFGFLFVFFTFFICGSLLFVMPLSCQASPDIPIGQGIERSSLPFQEEELSYTVSWANFVNAGSAHLVFSPGTYQDDQPVLTARAVARSAKWMKVLGIDVEDQIQTIFDSSYQFSYFFNARIKETDYNKTKTITFDWENNLVEYINRDEKPAYFNIQDNTHDVLSALYYVRTLPLKEGESFFVRVFDDGKEYLLEIKVFAREEVKVQEERIPAFKTQVILKTKGIFNRKGDVFIWFSDDDRRIPVQMRCDIFLGFFHVELANAQAYFHYR